MHKKVALGLVLLASSSPTWADCPAQDLPGSFEAKEKLISIGTDLLLTSGSKNFGRVVERTLHLARSFEFQNSANQVVAKARSRFFTLGAIVDIDDCAGNRIGTLKEDIWKSFFSVMTTYSILDSKGAEIGRSDKVELFSTDITLKDSMGAPIARIHRPALKILTDKWSVEILKQGAIDSRMIPFIPAFKTAADNANKSSDDDDDSEEHSGLSPDRENKASDQKRKIEKQERLPGPESPNLREKSSDKAI
ncbi:MAG: hypothetical protein ACXWP5_00810 [Bdellovibrionota bacterium]